tara:strand:- start:70 stop:432 length:363 start_codon:yes stop_codon:yes gene_type:complete
MIKLKKIIKEAFGDRKFGEPLPTFDSVMNDYQAGKLYTDKDKPPFKTEKQISESIPDYFRGYFDNIDSNMERLEKNVKQLIKDLGKDGLKKESLEVASLYKKHIIEFKVKMENFEKKYRD